MRYPLEPRKRKYVEGYGFLLFARKIVDKYSKMPMDNSTETGIDAAKTASKRFVQKAVNMSLINCEVSSLSLDWSESCALTSIARRDEIVGDNPVSGVTFQQVQLLK